MEKSCINKPPSYLSVVVRGQTGHALNTHSRAPSKKWRPYRNIHFWKNTYIFFVRNNFVSRPQHGQNHPCLFTL